MNNTNGHYQDNRAEYFMSHPSDLQAAGIQAVLFGKANGGQTNYTDDTGDGITNNNGVPTSGYQCNGCNSHASTVADDDGGFLRMAVANYYGPNPAPVPGPGGAYHPVVPQRILDTRTSLGGHPGRLGGGQSLDLMVAGQAGVQANAIAAVLNVTVTNTTSAGYLTLYPSGAARPTASNLNWVAGQTIPNLVEVKLGTSGGVTIFNSQGLADVVADVEGWVAAPSSPAGPDGLFKALQPARLLDTRDGTGGYQGPLGQGAALHMQVLGRGGVPGAGAEAVIVNVTVTNATATSFLTVWPTGGSLPTASNLNFTAGQTIPNRVIVRLGTGGQIDIYNHAGSVDVVVDVNGWFTDATAGQVGAGLVPLSPYRILDTRSGVGGFGSPVPGGSSIALPVAGKGGVPAMGSATPPRAVVLNVTVTDTTAPSFLTAWPDAITRPWTSDLNWVAGVTIPNFTVVEVGANGDVDFYNHLGSTDLVVDVVGYYN